MGKLKTLIDIVKNRPGDLGVAILNNLIECKITNIISDKQYLKISYRLYMGKKLNIEKPETFNEKLQWLKLNDRKDIYTKMVDKYEAKKYVASRIGQQYIIPTLGVWENFEDIQFDSLPDQFVLKCTHDSGSVVICKDKNKFDMNVAERKLKRGLKHNTFWRGREWPYLNAKPRILAETYLTDLDGDVADYKVHCFNGVPKFILVCRNRFGVGGLTEDFFDVSWNHLPVKRYNHPNSQTEIRQPENLEEMLMLSSVLSSGTLFLRVDFYSIGNKLYFGELTFYPACGLEPFEPEDWDSKFGEYLDLPMK